MSDLFDILVVGGGINGVGIARDAAGRGLRVLLCEKDDLAAATSSASSKMIHGGLRYLEFGEWRLVRESLAEREVLLHMAPHLVRPLRLVLPHGPGSRPRWMVRAGLFLYDHIGGRSSLPGTETLDLRSDPRGAPLLPSVPHGFAFDDCRTDDSRLTVVTARDAALRGAEILTRTALMSATRGSETWRAELRGNDGTRREVAARILVNAAGPWVSELLGRLALPAGAALRLVKGSHIVVPKLYEGEHAYLLQNDDRRVVFVIPFESDFTLIGTTELPFDGDPAEAQITPDETAYLCRAVGRWFRTAPHPADVVWAYAGVRPLYEDRASKATAVTRDYVFDLNVEGAPALSVFGGKLTTYRRLAEHALERLAMYLPHAGPPWTRNSVLPGGEGIVPGHLTEFAAELRREHPSLDAAMAKRLAEAYGSDARAILNGASSPSLPSDTELRWLIDNEWARTAEDIVWRRTKLGLQLARPQIAALTERIGRLTGSTSTTAGASLAPVLFSD